MKLSEKFKAVLDWHDEQYATHEFSRAYVDLMFYSCLLFLGMNWFKASAIYFAVRLGGGGQWDLRWQERRHQKAMALKELIRRA